MDLTRISQTLQHDAIPLVFLNVLLQQLGLPVPAVPTLLLAGSLAAAPGQLGRLLAAAVVASLVADWLWYHAGRAFGYRVLAGLCRLSLNPASCVSQTEARFLRWGVASVVLAKFIPGFSTVAPPIAGAMRMHQPSFLLAASAAGGLWAGLALLAGWLLQDTVRAVILTLDQHTTTALVLLLALAGLWLAWKLLQRHRFRRQRALPHISPAELQAALAGPGPHPRLLDLRGPILRANTATLPGAEATSTDLDQLLQTVADWPREQPIVTFCACPEDATAIEAARRLQAAGYRSVRPLRGGYDAWVARVGQPPLTAPP